MPNEASRTSCSRVTKYTKRTKHPSIHDQFNSRSLPDRHTRMAKPRSSSALLVVLLAVTLSATAINASPPPCSSADLGQGEPCVGVLGHPREKDHPGIGVAACCDALDRLGGSCNLTCGFLDGLGSRAISCWSSGSQPTRLASALGRRRRPSASDTPRAYSAIYLSLVTKAPLLQLAEMHHVILSGD